MPGEDQTPYGTSRSDQGVRRFDEKKAIAEDLERVHTEEERIQKTADNT